MAGFVTCANRWRKNPYKGRGVRASGAMGVSSPMDQVASLLSSAMGATTILMSSRL
jgi:hypothetical protein